MSAAAEAVGSSFSVTASPNGMSPEPATSTTSREGTSTDTASSSAAVVPTRALAAAVPSGPATWTSRVVFCSAGPVAGRRRRLATAPEHQPDPGRQEQHAEHGSGHQEDPLPLDPAPGGALGGPVAARHHGRSRRRRRSRARGRGG